MTRSTPRPGWPAGAPWCSPSRPGRRSTTQGAAALRAAGGRLASPEDPAVPAAIGAADLILDGLLGIGGRGGLREPQASLAGLAARSPAVVVAVDLPSGVDADTGVVEGAAIQADVTVTFGTMKPGLLVDPGAGHAGVVELVDIGLGPFLGPPDLLALQAADTGGLVARPPAESDKYRRGVAGIVAGSQRFTGAAALAVGGRPARRRRDGPAGVRRACGGRGPGALAGGGDHGDRGAPACRGHPGGRAGPGLGGRAGDGHRR